MAKSKEKIVEVSIDLTKDEAFEIVRAIDLRLRELDSLFKGCIKAEAKDGAEGVAKSIGIITHVRRQVTGDVSDDPEK